MDYAPSIAPWLGKALSVSSGMVFTVLGTRAQRLLFASTGTKDPQASDTLYIGELAAPTQMRGFRFGTASRLMLRPWRPGPVSALVAIYTIPTLWRGGPSGSDESTNSTLQPFLHF